MSPEKAEFKPVQKIKGGKLVKDVLLSQGHISQPLRLKVQEYIPNDTDKQFYPWKDANGVEHKYQCTPYAIADLDYCKRSIERFVKENTRAYVESLLPENGDIGRSISRAVFCTALVYSRVC